MNPSYTSANQAPPIIVDLGDGVTMTFRHIPADSFNMGARSDERSEYDQQPRHRVYIPHPFYLSETPVTLAQFKAFKSTHQNHYKDRAEYPVDSVSWNDCEAFAEWVNNEPEFLKVLWEASLPTEAQWEYACRARTETDYSSGDGSASLDEVGWYRGNGEKGDKPQKVKEKLGNSFGLYDMHGLIEEWCKDVYDEQAYINRLDGLYVANLGSSTLKVCRGGSFASLADECRASRRTSREADEGNRMTGFRLALNQIQNNCKINDLNY